MKTVVAAKNKHTVSSEACTSAKFYGVQNSGEKENRGYITREFYRQGRYVLVCPKCLTEGNSFQRFNESSLTSLIEMFIQDGRSVYEFDSFSEMASWVGEVYSD